MLDIRQEFPFFSANGPVRAYLDSAASAQKPTAVIEACSRFESSEYGNTHRGVHSATMQATQRYEKARETIAAFLNAPQGSTTVITRGTTHAINMVAGSWGEANIQQGDRIVLTTYEHHSNFLPWVGLSQRKGAQVELIELTDDGHIDMESAAAILAKGNVKLLALAHISNVLGSTTPLAELIELAHNAGAKVLVDGAQAVAHTPVDLSAMGADFYLFSGHKLYGPTGVGALLIAPGLAEEMPPYELGGGMVHIARLETPTWAPPPYRFEAGTPPITEAVGLQAAIEFVEHIGFAEIMAHEQELTALLLEKLAKLNFVKIYGSNQTQGRIGVVSFNIDGVHPHDAGTILDSEGVAVRVGHHCAQPLMKHLGVDATVRASLGVYNDINDIELLVSAIEKAHQRFA